MRPYSTAEMENITSNVVKVASTTPIAAKDHRCTICDQVIPKGSRHHRMVYRDDDARDPRKSLRFVRFHCQCPPMEDREP